MSRVKLDDRGGAHGCLSRVRIAVKHVMDDLVPYREALIFNLHESGDYVEQALEDAKEHAYDTVIFFYVGPRPRPMPRVVSEMEIEAMRAGAMDFVYSSTIVRVKRGAALQLSWETMGSRFSRVCWIGETSDGQLIIHLPDLTHDLEKGDEVTEKVLRRLFELPLEELKPEAVKLTLGGDPEFELLDIYSGRIIHAAQLIEDPDNDNPIGVDGAGYQVELRPAPANNPTKLVKNIMALLHKFSESYKGYDLSVQGHRYPLGGHIHFGGIDPAPEFLRLLDRYLAEPMWNENGEARGGYKRLSAYEWKDWGFEYRSLPSAYLVTPLIANITLKIALYLAQEYFTYGRKPKCEPDDLFKRILTPYECEKFWKFCRGCYRKIYRRILKRWGVEVGKRISEAILQDEWNYYIDIKLIGDLMLYGLHKDRGNVIFIWGVRNTKRIPKVFHDCRVEIKPHPAGIRNLGVQIGIPKEWRESPEHAHKIIELVRLVCGKRIIKAEVEE